MINNHKKEIVKNIDTEERFVLEIQKVFAEYGRRKMSERMKGSWKNRKDKLSKQKAPVSADASLPTIEF